MANPATKEETLYLIAERSGALKRCPIHEAYYSGTGTPGEAYKLYDQNQVYMKQFFSSRADFYDALRAVVLRHQGPICPKCDEDHHSKSVA